MNLITEDVPSAVDVTSIHRLFYLSVQSGSVKASSSNAILPTWVMWDWMGYERYQVACQTLLGGSGIQLIQLLECLTTIMQHITGLKVQTALIVYMVMELVTIFTHRGSSPSLV